MGSGLFLYKSGCSSVSYFVWRTVHWPIEAWNLNKRQSIGGISEWIFLNENVCILIQISLSSWWRHQMETFSASLVLREGNPKVTGVFPSQRPVTQGFGVFFDVRLNNGWANNWDVDDLRHHHTHYDVTVILFLPPIDHKSALIQVMAWCHFLMQQWSWLLTLICVTKAQCVDFTYVLRIFLYRNSTTDDNKQI